jgi:hypothetical protein
MSGQAIFFLFIISLAIRACGEWIVRRYFFKKYQRLLEKEAKHNGQL